MTDRYLIRGVQIATTLQGAAHWARNHPAEWKVSSIHLVMDGDSDEYAIDVDADVRDEIEAEINAEYEQNFAASIKKEAAE